MSETDLSPRSPIKRVGRLMGSRIARLIFASNLAGLAILIVGAISSLLDEGATIGKPAPALQLRQAQDIVQALNLPASVRAVVSTPDGEIVADSFFLSERVDVSALPPIQEPGAVTRLGAGLSDWAANAFSALMPNRGGDAVRTQTLE